MACGETHQIVWDFLVGVAYLSGNIPFKTWKKAPNIAYEDVLIYSHKIWCVQGLIATRSNLVVTWKIRPHMGIIS